MQFIGDIDGDEVRRIIRESRVFTVGERYVLTLLDLSQVKSISSEARKAAVEIRGDVAARGTAIFGVSGHLRIVMSLLMRALQLLHQRADRPVLFFHTEEEARAWLAERRNVLQSGDRLT